MIIIAMLITMSVMMMVMLLVIHARTNGMDQHQRPTDIRLDQLLDLPPARFDGTNDVPPSHGASRTMMIAGGEDGIAAHATCTAACHGGG